MMQQMMMQVVFMQAGIDRKRRPAKT